MKTTLVLALFALVAVTSAALAQSTLPTTDIRSATKPRPVAHRTIVGTSGPRLSPSLSIVPGATDAERSMSDAEFQAFQARHPTVVYIGRCYAGTDPDPNIRTALFRGGSLGSCS